MTTASVSPKIGPRRWALLQSPTSFERRHIASVLRPVAQPLPCVIPFRCTLRPLRVSVTANLSNSCTSISSLRRREPKGDGEGASEVIEMGGHQQGLGDGADSTAFAASVACEKCPGDGRCSLFSSKGRDQDYAERQCQTAAVFGDGSYQDAYMMLDGCKGKGGRYLE